VAGWDPVLLEVVWNRLRSIADEQTKALMRASFTPLARDAEDLACGLFDRRGNMIVQSVTGTAGHINSLATGVKHFLKEYPPERLEPGDVLITNDPWKVSGHKHDITTVVPIFHRTEFVGLAGCTCHVLDVGGRILSAEGTDVYEEGLLIPIMKLFRRGRRNEDLFRLIAENVRHPEAVVGDILAHVAGNQVGVAKVREFLDEHGLPDLEEASRQILDRSEETIRRAIAAVPDGSSEFEMFLDGIDAPLRIAVRIEVRGSDVHVDFAGSSPQVGRGINSCYNYTHAYTTYGINSALCPEIPANDGTFRPVHVSVPEGSFLNPIFPAPVAARHLTGHFTATAVWGALARLVPGRSMADSCSVTILPFAGTTGEGGRFMASFFASGGMGARATKDGIPAKACPSNVSNTPVEVIESTSPLFIRQKAFIPDSGGAGAWQGGAGQAISVEVRSPHPAVLSCMYDKVKAPPFGLDGGQPGRPTRFFVSGPRGMRHPDPKQKTVLEPGEEITLELAGGGGYGAPAERDPGLVLRDVVAGIVSRERAREVYGVVIEGEPPRVDEDATRACRAAAAS
jgi:N-methylhydantoinase B